MKRYNLLIAILVVMLFFVFAVGSGESESVDQGSGSVGTAQKNDNQIGKYTVVIDSCRLAKDYSGEDVVIVKYIFTNVSDEDAAAFNSTIDAAVYQNGVGLNEAYILSESANFSLDNQRKAIKKGASVEVEVAYKLNDTTTDIEVEVSEYFSFEDTTLKKTFSISD